MTERDRRTRADHRGRSRAVVFVSLLYLSCAGLWYLTVPPIETPDENAHYDYVRYLAKFRHLPSELPAPGWNPHCWWHPPLYYASVAPILAVLGPDQVRIVSPQFNESPLLLGLFRVFLFDGRITPPIEAMYWVRLVSLVFGLGTVLFAFSALRHVLDDPRQAALAASGLILVPQFTFLSIAVSNDTLVTLLSAWAVVLLIRFVRGSGATCSALAIGLVTGLALTAKLNAAYLMPTAALAIVLRHRSLKPVLARLVALGSGVTLTSGWYYARNLVVFGDPFASAFKLQVMNAPELQASTHHLFDPYFITTFPRDLFETFWASFGRTTFGVGWPQKSFYAVITLLLAAGVAWYLVRTFISAATPRRERDTALMLAAGVFIALAMIVSLNLTWSAAQARLAYPALVPALCLAGLGARSLASEARRWVPQRGVALAAFFWFVAMATGWFLAWRWALIGFFAV